MNGSTFCEIKYICRDIFAYDSDWGWSENTGTPIPKLPTSYSPMQTPPPPKEINTFLKMFPKSKVFNYQKNQGLFIFREKIKFSKQNQR